MTLTNTSPKVMAVTSIALIGTAADQFAETNNCGSSLMGHATCTIKATFKPTTKGAKSAFLNVNGGGGGLRTAALTGTGTWRVSRAALRALRAIQQRRDNGELKGSNRDERRIARSIAINSLI